MYEIHIFVGSAVATIGNEYDYPKGEKHAFVLYSRQPTGEDHDTELAESHMNQSGWEKVEISRAGTLNPETMNPNDETGQQAFQAALEDGAVIIAYSTPIEEDDV